MASLYKKKNQPITTPKRRKAISTTATTSLNTTYKEEEEDDCGFKFRRLNEPPSKAIAVKKKNDSDRQENIISRRRRSSFALIAARRTSFPSNDNTKNGSGRNSSIAFSISLTMKLPSSDIHPAFYHRHLLPDLPGPVKMRQLLIWAVQKVAHQRASELTIRKGKNLHLATEAISKALYSNQINCSWYQRSSQSDSISSDNVKKMIPKGPKNQEIADCIDLYQRYCSKLYAELQEWEEMKKNLLSPLQIPSPSLDETFNGKEGYLKALELQKWWSTQWPLGVDRFCWAISSISMFEEHSSIYCELVFRQLRQRIWGEQVSSDIRKGIVSPESKNLSTTVSSSTPIMLLRALSSAKASLN